MNAVSYYGIHFDDDNVAWLVQGDRIENTIGLKGAAPFTLVRPPHSAKCNHYVDLNQPDPPISIWKQVTKLVRDPLFQLMLPLPKKRVFVGYLSDSVKEVLIDLSRLTNPARSIVNPIWMAGEAPAIFNAMSISNIQPYSLTNVELFDLPLLRQVAPHQPQLPRQLIVTSTIREGFIPSGMTRLETELKPHPEWPWERIGVKIIRMYMRGEWK